MEMFQAERSSNQWMCWEKSWPMVGFPDHQFTRDQEGDHDHQEKNNTKKRNHNVTKIVKDQTVRNPFGDAMGVCRMYMCVCLNICLSV